MTGWTDEARAQAGRLGWSALSLSTRWDLPGVDGDPAAIDAEVRAAAKDLLVAINRHRRSGLVAIVATDREQVYRAAIAAAIDPLLDALAADSAALVVAACRLYFVQAVAIPRDEWWTPDLVDILARHVPEVDRTRIGTLCMALNEMTFAVIARWPFRALPVDAEERGWLRNLLERTALSVYASEFDFLGRLVR